MIGMRARYLAEFVEEASGTYREVPQVVAVTHNTGISRIVARTKSITVIKI
jgi:RNA-splicing ligase RtcB